MSLATIRASMRTAVDAISGVGPCFPRIPETKPTETTFAVVETPQGLVEPYGTDIERREYQLNVWFLTRRNGDLWAEQLVVEPFIDSFPTAMLSAFTLGGQTYGMRYGDPAWELMEVQIDDQAYIGPKFTTLHKVKAAVTYAG